MSCFKTFILLKYIIIKRFEGYVAKIALTANAAFVIVYHNHPSGDTTPSEPDIQMTEDLSDVLGVLGIQLMDHIITGADGSISLVEDGHFCFDEDYDDGDDD